MEVSVNIHGYDVRVNIRPLGTQYAVRLHTKSEHWATASVCIFVKDPGEIAAWQTLADTLAALDVKEDVA